MQVILLKDLDNVGDKHTIATVKDGYGRNFLIPRGMAIEASKNNRARLEEMKQGEAAAEAARVNEYKEMADKINGNTLTIRTKAGTSGKIFGSVSAVHVVSGIREAYGVEIERRKVILSEEIKNLGDYSVILNLHPDVQVTLPVSVVEE